MQIIWTLPARRDLRAQLLYLAERNPEAAHRAQTDIYAAVGLLADFPQRGRPGRLDGTRELVITGWPYVVIYRIRQERVRILRIIHASQEWPSEVE